MKTRPRFGFARRVRRGAATTAAAFALAGVLAPRAVAQVDETRYAWEFPVVTQVAGADALVGELRAQVQRVLDAGPLAPLYLSYADQESVGYTVYQEPGRIVTTLAWAYPHLGAAQQTDVRAYVAATFADARFSPWGVTVGGKNGNSNYPLPHSVGAPREDHPKEKWWYERSDFGNNRPFLHPLYGAWLYGWRTGDWAAVDAAWPAIRTRYTNYGATPQAQLYGTAGLHAAVARLAARAGDTATRDTALARLRTALTTGLDFAAVETIARGTAGLEWQSPYGSYPNMYDSRMDGSTYRGWVFLNLTPEIGRYLAEENATLRAVVLARHASGKATFPLWWMPKAGYFNRSWTGDEGSGLLPEVVGMIAPVERWVAGADATALARQMRGAPNGVGDCYWLEALVQAIEAHGQLAWRDVRWPGVAFETWRTSTFGTDAGAPAAQTLGDWDGDGLANLLERALGRDPRVAGPSGVTVGRTADGLFLTLAYDEVKEAWDVEYVVEASGDLVTWQGGASATAEVSRTDLGATRRVTVRDRVALAAASRRFLRLKVRLVP